MHDYHFFKETGNLSVKCVKKNGVLFVLGGLFLSCFFLSLTLQANYSYPPPKLLLKIFFIQPQKYILFLYTDWFLSGI